MRIKIENKKYKLLLGSVIILLLLLVIGFFVGQQKKPTMYDSSAVAFNTKPHKKVPTGQMIIPAFGDLTATYGAKKIPVAFNNIKQNHVCFKYTVMVLKPKKEVLLATKLIKPGTAVRWMKMPKHNDIGDYPLSIKITAYELNGLHKQLNGSSQQTTLKIVKQ